MRGRGVGALLLVAGCVEFLPGGDRALDAAVVEAAVVDASVVDVRPADRGPATPDLGVDPPRCGGRNQSCCAADRCNDGHVCVRADAATCQRCGANREPCCEGSRCEGERTCAASGRCE